MNLQFSITICLSLFTAGWYVVTKGNILSAVLCFCDLRADCLESKVTSDRELSIRYLHITIILCVWGGGGGGVTSRRNVWYHDKN